MAKTFRPYDPEQLLMLPPSLREWLPEDHLVYFVSDVVETLDLSAIYASYDEERGYPPYHPLLITRILLYGYARGVYSSRKLARACIEDVAFRTLCAGSQPDFRTIAEFRKRHLEALSGLFVQILQLCRAAGLVKLGHVAIDSTKIKANASKHKAMSYGRMQEEEQRLRAEIKRLLARSEAEDAAEDELYGPDRRGDELPEELRRREGRLKKIQEAKAALEQEAKEAAQRKGEADAAVPDKAQRNFTDPDSRIMKDSSKAFVQAYSAQLAVDADSQVIVETELLQASNDKGQLVPMVERVCDRVEETPAAVSADTGYWTEADIATMEWYEIPAYVATKKIRHSEWRDAAILPEPVPDGLSRKERMTYLLRTERGRAEFNKRKQTVEPVIGQIKEARGFRRLLLRGHPKVRGEWRFVCTVHNLLKLFGSGWKPRRAAMRLAVVGGTG
ncbi:MAG: IS1182 family transposase [Acidobacteria bacterium]|nr:IS1182 family transposase [Acidobacteriota bacterium]